MSELLLGITKPVELIYCDPPWKYADRKVQGACEKHYPGIEWRKALRLERGWSEKKATETTCLTKEEMQESAQATRSIVADNAVMICWGTCPKYADGDILDYIKASGFTPKTIVWSWFKLVDSGIGFIYGPGHYTASGLEFAMLGVRGKGLGRPIKKMLPSVVSFDDEEHLENVLLCKRGKHSQKPLLHDHIDSMYPNRVKLELFAREQYGDWPAIGCEVTGNDILVDLALIRKNIERSSINAS